MITNNYNSLLVVGFVGEAGSGKTSLAKSLVPEGNFDQRDYNVTDYALTLDSNVESYDHLYFAMPIYNIISSFNAIEGYMSKDRILYEIHEIIKDLYGSSPIYGAPEYEYLISLTQQVYQMSRDYLNRTREFKIALAKLLRQYDDKCFVKCMKRKIVSEYLSYVNSYKNDIYRDVYEESAELPYEEFQVMLGNAYNKVENITPLVIVISDVRSLDQASLIYEYFGGRLIKLKASKDVRLARIQERDGYNNWVNEELSNHSTELEVLDIPEDWFDLIIETDKVSQSDEILIVKNHIQNITRKDIYASPS